MNTFLKKHLISLLCVLSLIVMALPLATIESSVEIFGQVSTSDTTITGFNVLSRSIVGYLLILGPVLLIAMNYIKQIEKYKGTLAVAVPSVCLLALVIVVIQSKSFSSSTSGSDGLVEAEISLKLGIGTFLAGLSYIATAIAGAVEYHNFTLDKASLAKLKEDGSSLFEGAQARLSQTVHSISTRETNDEAGEAQSHQDTVSAPNPPAKPYSKRAINATRTEEILTLIEKLSKMKDSGILSEEEFSDKKKQLLEEI